MADKELGESTHKGKTITSLQVVDVGSLIKDFYSRGANYVHITTPTDCGVLFQPIKDVVARRSFDTYCTTRDENRAKAFKPPNGLTVLVILQARCTAPTNHNRSMSDRPASRLFMISTFMAGTLPSWERAP